MARKETAETRRKKTVESLREAIRANNITERFLLDKVDEYMSFYDNLSRINRALKEMDDGEFDQRAYTSMTAEKRRISNEMRSILKFLGLEPADATLPSQEQADEEL